MYEVIEITPDETRLIERTDSYQEAQRKASRYNSQQTGYTYKVRECDDRD